MQRAVSGGHGLDFPCFRWPARAFPDRVGRDLNQTVPHAAKLLGLSAKSAYFAQMTHDCPAIYHPADDAAEIPEQDLWFLPAPITVSRLVPDFN